MAFKGRSLADGQLANSQGEIYKVPQADFRAIVSSLHVFNTGSTAETVNIYLRRGPGTIRQIYRAVLNQYESFSFDTITLTSEDSLYGDTTTAGTVNYVLTGAVE